MTGGPLNSHDVEPSTSLLVERSRAGSAVARKRAYSELVRRFEMPVRNLLRHLCHNAAIADELAQDAFLAGWLKIATLRDPNKFGAWVKQIAYREFLHGARRQRLETRFAADMAQGAAVEPAEADDVESLFVPCSTIEREIMILHYACEFKLSEIASARGMPVGSVKSHIHRAKQKIRAYLLQTEPRLEECGSG